jgi:hypothetical protein
MADEEKREGEQQEMPVADMPEAPANVEMPIEQQPTDPLNVAAAGLGIFEAGVFEGAYELRLPIQKQDVMTQALVNVNTVITTLAEKYGLSVFNIDVYKNALVLRERINRALADRQTAEKIVDLQTIMARAMDAENTAQNLADVVENLELKLGEGFSGVAAEKGYVPKANVPDLAVELGYVSPHEDSNRFSQAVKEAGYVPRGTVPEGYVAKADVPTIAANQYSMVTKEQYQLVENNFHELRFKGDRLKRCYDRAIARARKAEAALKGKGKKR